jgi:hypothetical protein
MGNIDLLLLLPYHDLKWSNLRGQPGELGVGAVLAEITLEGQFRLPHVGASDIRNIKNSKASNSSLLMSCQPEN